MSLSNATFKGYLETKSSADITESKRLGKKIHPARCPAAIPEFFINFLTEPKAKVMDSFAGSNTTGHVAERLERKWIAVEKNEEYAKDTELRFLGEQPKVNGKPANGQKALFQ